MEILAACETFVRLPLGRDTEFESKVAVVCCRSDCSGKPSAARSDDSAHPKDEDSTKLTKGLVEGERNWTKDGRTKQCSWAKPRRIFSRGGI